MVETVFIVLVALAVVGFLIWSVKGSKLAELSDKVNYLADDVESLTQVELAKLKAEVAAYKLTAKAEEAQSIQALETILARLQPKV